MLPGLVAGWSARATGAASLTITLTGETIAAGDLIHVETFVFSNISVAPATPTDGTHVYTPRTAAAWSSTFRSVCGSAWAIATAGVSSVTVAPSTGTADIAGVVYHVALPVTPAPVNTSTANDVAATSSPIHTAVTSAAQNELWFCAATHDGSAIVPTAPPGFTIGQANFDGSAGEPYASAYKFFTNPQTAVAPGWDMTVAANVALCLTAYEMAATLPETARATHAQMRGR